MDQLTTRIDQLSPLQRAAFLVKEAQGKLEALQRAQNEPIAIIGMACRFPGVDNPDSFWQLLARGGNAISEMPSDRWDINAFYDPDPRAPGKMNSRWGGFLEKIDEFDNAFFGISAQEAARMDPQQRMMLELALEAMEDAGLAPDRLAGSKTSVFVGVSLSEYGLFFLNDLSLSDAYVGVGTSLCIVANRISFAFDLRGPSLSLDTACSSSLAGIHLACQSLRSGESRCALVGGSNLMLTPPPLINLTKAGFHSPEGRCRSFDADASGYVRSEGCGMVVLKTLSAALTDNDPIHAVILGSAMNQDGQSNGVKAPNRTAQEAVLRDAYIKAGVSPGKVQYIETQGTGTPLGDAIEIQALATVLAKDRARGKSVTIGSVKTNLGHLEAASGMAGLLKTVLAIKHRTIPANLHFSKPNPHAPFEALPFEVPTQSRPWPRQEGPALAGVSAFGFGGTNVHLVLQEAPERQPVRPEASARAPARQVHLLPISAKTPAALEALARAYRDQLHASEAASFGEICASAASGRQHYDHRLAFTAVSTAAAARLVDAFLAGKSEPGVSAGSKPYNRLPKTVFVLGDSLRGWAAVSRTLRGGEASFRTALEECEKVLLELAEFSALDWLDDWQTNPSDTDSPEAGLALFVLQTALIATWKTWGVSPNFVLGMGRGETAAAHASGSLTLVDGLKIMLRRGVRAPRPSDRVQAPVESKDPSLPLVLGGQGLVRRGRDLVESYWVKGPRVPADLAECLQALRERQPEVFLELGAGTLADVIPPWNADNKLQARFVASFDEVGEGLDRFATAVAGLYTAGQSIAWDRIYPRTRVPVPLPHYPWQRRRFWIDHDRYYSHSFGIADRYSNDGKAAPAPSALQAIVETGAEPSIERSWLFDLVWEPKAKTWIDKRHLRMDAEDLGSWLILLDKAGVGEQLAARLEADKRPCTRLQADDPARLESLLAQHFSENAPKWAGIVDLRALDIAMDASVGSASLVDKQTGLCQIISELVRRIAVAPGAGETKLWVLTRGGQQVTGSIGAAAVPQAAVWGLGRTLAQEMPRHWGGLIDLDPEASAEESAAKVADQILLPDDEMQIAFRAAQRYVGRLALHLDDEQGREKLRWRADSSYLLTGGLGGLGPLVARWMVEQGARRLVLLGRTELPPRKEWTKLDPESEVGRKVAAIRELEAHGASVHLAVVDLADEEKLRDYLDAYKADGWPAIAGVVHLADEMQVALAAGYNADQFRRMFRAKSGGAWALHRALGDRPLDFFVMFSSSAALLPSPLLGGFGAASAPLDALADYRRSLGLPALSINWSDWSQRSLVQRVLEAQQMPAPRNVKGVTNAQGLAVFGRLLHSGAAHSAVIPLTPEDWLKRPAAPFESRVREEMVLRNPSAAAVRPRPELSTPYAAPSTDLERYLADLWQTALKVDRVGVHDNFFELGGDSLQGAVLLNRLQEGLKEVIHPHVLFETRCIHDYAVYLRRECPSGVKRNFPNEQVGGNEADWDPDWPAFVEEEHIDKARELINAGHSRTPARQAGPKNPRAIFVLSPPRSGSTLFRVMMAGHPQLFAPPELELLAFETLKDRRQAYTDDTVAWLEGADRALMELRGCTADEAAASIQEMEQSGMTTKAFYRLLQDSVPGRFLVDKTPANSSKIETLRHAEDLFEDALYIHLLRHPCAMILSYVEYKLYQTYVDRFRLRGKFPFAPRQMGELTWLVSNRNIMTFLQEIPAERQYRMVFEDLVTEPETNLRKLCDFLQLPYHPDMADPYRNKEGKMTSGTRPEKRMHGDQKFLIAHKAIDPTVAHRWKEEMSADVLGNATRSLAAALGYKDVPPPANRQMSAAGPAAAIPRLAPSAPMPVVEQIDHLSEDDLDNLLQGMLLETQEKKS